MLIGINNLDQRYSSIEMPGLFVMTVPTFSFAKSILLKTVIDNPYTKTALISFEERSGLFDVPTEINKKLFDIYSTGNLLLSFVYMKSSKHLFSEIKQDMGKKLFASIDLVLIDIEQNVFSRTTDDELATILSSWQSWLIRHKKTCVWVVHSDITSNFIRNRLLNINNIFNGLANIECDSTEIKYEVLFWRSHSSIQSNVLLNLQFDEINHAISANENVKLTLKNPLTFLLPENNNVLLAKPKDNSQEIFPCEWNIFYSLDELENEVVDNISSTIIIYIDSSTNINYIASRVLKLRKIGGAQLKIIIREMEQCLRNIEEKFIINVGANLIIPYGVDLLRFITIVYAMQGSYFIRNIPNKIEDICHINLNGCGKSYLPLTDFVKQAIYLVDYAKQMKINSSLFKLTFNRAIPVEEIAALIKINHNGDIFSFTENNLYLFLFQCEQSEITTILSQLILLPTQDLFFEQKTFSYFGEIIDEIKSIATDKQEQNKHGDYKQWQAVINTSEVKKKIARKPPISSPLTLKIN